jgi:hypothetical protein
MRSRVLCRRRHALQVQQQRGWWSPLLASIHAGVVHRGEVSPVAGSPAHRPRARAHCSPAIKKLGEKHHQRNMRGGTYSSISKLEAGRTSLLLKEDSLREIIGKGISKFVPVDLQQVFPMWHKSDVTTSLAASPHLLRVCSDLFICGSQVAQRLLECLR